MKQILGLFFLTKEIIYFSIARDPKERPNPPPPIATIFLICIRKINLLMNLRPITNKDQLDLKKVYFDSIQSIDESIYSKDQKRAWSSQAWQNSDFEKSIVKGNGWLIYYKETIIAFASRYPNNRIALFYCKGKSQRKGYGSKLLYKLEDESKKEGLDHLYTEASLISYRLFLKHNWEIKSKEKVIINNNYFERYKMIKILNN